MDGSRCELLESSSKISYVGKQTYSISDSPTYTAKTWETTKYFKHIFKFLRVGSKVTPTGTARVTVSNIHDNKEYNRSSFIVVQRQSINQNKIFDNLITGFAVTLLSWFFPDILKTSWFSCFWLKILILSWYFMIHLYRTISVWLGRVLSWNNELLFPWSSCKMTIIFYLVQRWNWTTDL